MTVKATGKLWTKAQAFFSVRHVKRTFEGPFFTLEYPGTWDHEIIEDIPAFYDRRGAGALQVAAVRNSDQLFSLEQEMSRYLQRHGIEYDSSKVLFAKDGEKELATCEFVKEGRFWLVYMTSIGDRIVVAIYNADEVPGEEMASIISHILRSIRFRV